MVQNTKSITQQFIDNSLRMNKNAYENLGNEEQKSALKKDGERILEFLERKANEVVNTQTAGRGLEFTNRVEYKDPLKDIITMAPSLTNFFNNIETSSLSAITPYKIFDELGDPDTEVLNQQNQTFGGTIGDHSKEMTINLKTFSKKTAISNKNIRYNVYNEGVINNYLTDLINLIPKTEDDVMINSGTTGYNAIQNARWAHLGVDGLRKRGLVAGKNFVVGVIDVGTYSKLIKMHENLADDIIYIVPTNISADNLNIAEALTADKTGNNQNTFNSGILKDAFGNTIFRSRFFPAKVQEDGTIAALPSNLNTFSSLLSVNRKGVYYSRGANYDLKMQETLDGVQMKVEFDFGFTILPDITNYGNFVSMGIGAIQA